MNEGSLQFHVKENDDFGTLATVLDLVSQDLRRKGDRGNAETLGRLRRSADVPSAGIPDREGPPHSKIAVLQ
jgi:hypothetical protein